MITHICVSLPAACTAVADDTALHLLDLFFKLNEAVNILQQADVTGLWQHSLPIISQGKNTAPVIAGYSTRLLFDRKLLDGEQLYRAFYYAMSRATAPATAAAWLEGFLKGSGALLLLDKNLWMVVNDWVRELTEDIFTQVLPLPRRTVASFTGPEKKKLG